MTVGPLEHPDASRLLTITSPVIATAGAAAGALYWRGVRALARRGRRWPLARSAAFGAGVVCLVYGLGSGLADYDDASFALHMVQHLLVGMIGPLFLAASGLVTLGLQSAPTPSRRGLRWLVHTRGVQIVTQPLVGVGLFLSALVVSVWPPAAQLAIQNDAFHSYLHLHLLLAGAALWWPALGVDRALRARPGASFLVIVAMIPVHAFVAVSLLTARAPVGGAPFRQLARGWAFDPIADQRAGAAVLWIGGEIVTIVAATLVGRRWYLADRRAAARADRRRHPELEPA